MQRAEVARIRGDLTGMEAIWLELEAALKKPDARLADLHYDAGYVLWRCLQQLHDIDDHTEQQQRYPAQARAHVDALLSLEPNSLEATILEGVVAGV